MGFGQLHLVESDVTTYKQSMTRTSAGAEKWLDVHKWETMDTCIARMRLQGRRVLVTHFDENAIPITVRCDTVLCAARPSAGNLSKVNGQQVRLCSCALRMWLQDCMPAVMLLHQHAAACCHQVQA